VHARSTTFHGRPDSVDAGIAFITGEVGPMLDGMDGCRGLSLLVDRQTGLCIATTSWDSEAAMLASNEQLHPMRERGRDIMGGSIDVDIWEVVAMHHHGQHGECCRVSWLRGDLDTMTETVRAAVLPQLEQMPGFCSMSLFADRPGGIGCATTVWKDLPAMEASRAMADDMRNRTASDSASEVVDVHEFEVAYSHLHVPETV
jgi:heme-degrading monooxygenase HmoA